MPLPPSVFRFLLPAAALLLLVGLVYRDAPDNVFHFDDAPNILDWAPIHITELTPGNLINAALEAAIPNRPLPNATFAFDWWRGGGDPRPFQWTNLVIHGAVALSVYLLLALALRRLDYRWGAAVGAAVLCTAIWAVHPIQVQAVTYVVQRMASMAALFSLLAVAFYILGRTTERPGPRGGYFILAGLAMLLGFASKENTVVVPFLLLLAEYGLVRQGRDLIRSRLDVLLLLLPIMVLAWVVADILSGGGPLTERFVNGYKFRSFTLEERLLTQPRVIAFHFSQIFWPLPGRFSLEHEFASSTGLFSPPSTAFCLAGVVLWCAAGLRALLHVRWRVAGFFLLWVPATLAVESTFIPLEMVFEHRMYLPSVGLAGLLALAAAWCLERAGRLRPSATVVLAGLVIVLAAATILRVPVWSSELGLARNSLEHAPNSARAWTSVGWALKNLGRWDEAEVHLRRALELDPRQPAALHFLAIRAMDEGNLEEAEDLIARRLRRGFINHYILNTVGELRLKQGRVAEAVAYFQRAIALDYKVPAYRWNLALAFERAGNCRQARMQWRAYLELETNAEDLAAVRKHLEKNFDTEGGSCFAP
jgi:Tfp pilus assembly protein PilF